MHMSHYDKRSRKLIPLHTVFEKVPPQLGSSPFVLLHWEEVSCVPASFSLSLMPLHTVFEKVPPNWAQDPSFLFFLESSIFLPRDPGGPASSALRYSLCGAGIPLHTAFENLPPSTGL